MILPEDCIREILEQLSEDKRTLYSCLITNRTYCQFVVPILWRNPWPTFNSLTNELERIYWKILGKTIIKCLTLETKQKLSKQFQIYLNPSLLQKPLFNYVSYIQIIPVEQIFNKEFWELFIKQCKIKSLEIPNFNIFEYPESKIHLSSLSILKIFISYPKEMIIELSKNVHTLKRIEIFLIYIYEDTMNDIENLFISQKNLKEINFMFIAGQKFIFNNKKSIDYLSNSLKILELCSCICLSANIISSFINLTELKIFYHISLYHDEGIEILSNVILPKLEILSLVNVKGEHLSIFTKLIENTKVLPIWLISVFYLKNFEDLLISCPKIRKIIIHFKSIFTPNNNFIPIDIVLAKPILILLSLKSSIHLNNIHLIGRWSFSSLDLQEFFELWKEMKRKPLKFVFNNNIYSHYIIRVCEYYHQKGVIKKGTINYTTPCTYYDDVCTTTMDILSL
ncbi:6611_t:CDS:2 [Rhizophagus irregularis]|nr:6611_t:CDS:2 [Rhizophagus irregularis]